jgi:hypothetical protein
VTRRDDAVVHGRRTVPEGDVTAVMLAHRVVGTVRCTTGMYA